MTGTRRAAIVAGVIVAVGCKAKEPDAEPGHAVVNAQTVVVTPQAFTETIGALGTVVARAGHVATLSAPAAGHVAAVNVTVGQTVTSGQPHRKESCRARMPNRQRRTWRGPSRTR